MFCTTHKCIVDEGLFAVFVESSDTPSATAFTIENLIQLLLAISSKWKLIGEALLLDKNRLDEIFRDKETDEVCLREMLEVYMMGTDLSHCLEGIESALRNIKEEQLADRISCLGTNSGR